MLCQIAIILEGRYDYMSEATRMRIAQLEKFIDKGNRFSDRLSERVITLEKSQSVINLRFKQILKSLEELKADLSLIKDKPARRLDLVITIILTSGISGLVGFLIKIALK